MSSVDKTIVFQFYSGAIAGRTAQEICGDFLRAVRADRTGASWHFSKPHRMGDPQRPADARLVHLTPVAGQVEWPAQVQIEVVSLRRRCAMR